MASLVSLKNEDIRDCKTIFELAELLNLDIKTLLFFAYRNEELYTHYKIKKRSGGERNISAPTEALKTTCRRLAGCFNEVYAQFTPFAVHGFLSNRSIITNATNHLSRKYILNIDLDNFFQTINTGRVMGLLKAYPFNFNNKLASVVAGIITYKNCLPQGSPASPVVSNMICRKLDKELAQLAISNNWIYSRYADDITISSKICDNNLIIETKEGVIVGKAIQEIINRNGFSINKRKTRLACPNQSKWVTGVKVNDKLNVSRKFIREVRAMLFSLERIKVTGSTLDDPESQKLLRVIRGKIAHIGNVKSKENIIHIKLHNRLCELEDRSHKRVPESIKEKYKENILLIKSSLGFGSGFFIGKNILITAAHVVGEDKTVEITTSKRRLPAEFKGASVVYVDKEKDLAILWTISNVFLQSIFKVDFSNKNYDHDTDYISIGYGGFRANGAYWSDASIVDQRIVQIMQDSNGNKNYLVNNPMWSGMSGGPVISQKTGLVVGYIVYGAPSLSVGHEVKTHAFKSIANIPIEYRSIKEN